MPDMKQVHFFPLLTKLFAKTHKDYLISDDYFL